GERGAGVSNRKHRVASRAWCRARLRLEPLPEPLGAACRQHDPPDRAASRHLDTFTRAPCFARRFGWDGCRAEDRVPPWARGALLSLLPRDTSNERRGAG